MGKRSNFPHNERDFYPTPYKAVLPLIPHLRGVRTFAEPCCGDGALVRHLEAFRKRCVYAGDIATGQDALALDRYGEADANITNPPYDTDHGRKLMHELIVHFQKIAPTWLLLHLDWASNKHARPFLVACSDIVVIGRVQWFPGSESGSTENFAWYRFDIRHSGGPIFHNGDASSPRRTRTCGGCGEPYRPQRSTARFCSNACRQQAYRERLSVTLA